VKDILYGRRELFLPGYEDKVEKALDLASFARDEAAPDEAQHEIGRAIRLLAAMFESKEGREKAKKDADLKRLIEEARARGQATRAAREAAEAPVVEPKFPVFASAPPADGGRRRTSRRGRKTRRKSRRSG